MREHFRERTLRPRSDPGLRSRPSSGSGSESDPGVRDLRLGAKGLITAGDRVLLIQERRPDGSSFWTIPGGGVKAEESLPECLRREVDEEIRCGVNVGEVTGSYVYTHTSRPVTTLYAVFEVTLNAAPAPNADERIVNHGWWTPEDLPTTTLAPVAEFIEEATEPDSR